MIRAIFLAGLLLLWAAMSLWIGVRPAFAQGDDGVMIPLDLTVSLSVILAGVTLAFTWFRTRKSTSQKRDTKVDARFTKIEGRLEDGARRMDRMDARLTATEQKITDLPDKDNFHSLELAMERMAGQLGVLSTKIQSGSEFMSRVDQVLARQEEYLLNKGDEK